MGLTRVAAFVVAMVWAPTRSNGFSAVRTWQASKLRPASTSTFAEPHIRHRVQWQTTSDTGSAERLEFDALDGELLRTAALRSGIVSPHNGRANLINCRGLGTCGTCAVGIARRSPPLPLPSSSTTLHVTHKTACIVPENRSAVESFRLSVPPGHGPSSIEHADLRLACQVKVHGDITVTKYTGFWGQNIGQVAPCFIPTLPFGSWEFALDTQSPARRSTIDK